MIETHYQAVGYSCVGCTLHNLRGTIHKGSHPLPQTLLQEKTVHTKALSWQSPTFPKGEFHPISLPRPLIYAMLVSSAANDKQKHSLLRVTNGPYQCGGLTQLQGA